ncbi:unnamed protein product [Closterium sp. Naga37s-1]|nr:unnamed protein product [Closterium sp. Naga37s-1]
MIGTLCMDATASDTEMKVGGCVKRNQDVVEWSQNDGGVVKRDEEQMGLRRVRNEKKRRKANSSGVKAGPITGGTLAFVTLLLMSVTSTLAQASPAPPPPSPVTPLQSVSAAAAPPFTVSSPALPPPTPGSSVSTSAAAEAAADSSSTAHIPPSVPVNVGSGSADAAASGAVISNVMTSGATLPAANQSDAIPDPIIRPPPTGPFSLSSPLPPPIRGPIVPAPPAPCFGVTVAYVIESIINIPSVWNGSVKPYGFKSKIELLNTGKRDLVGWEVRVEFTRNELITLLGNAQVEYELPYPGSALLFSSIDDQSDRLITAIHAGGDVRQYVVFAEVFGTEFGAATASKALPRTLYLSTPGFHCASNRPQFPSPNRIQVCCRETSYPPPPPPRPPPRLPPIVPALTVQIDVTAASDMDHQMLVTISNLQADRRVGPPRNDPWALSWRWMQNEIVWEAYGAQTTQQGNCQQQSASSAVYGAAIASAHSCSPRPTFVDLPGGSYGSESGRDLGATLGVRLACCKNGSIGLRSFPYGDPALAQYQGNASLAQFRLRIGRTRQFKAIPSIAPPRNLSLGLPGIVCSAGVRIDPTQFPVNPSRNLSAVATWRYACYRDPTFLPPRPACCVSFSAAFNNTGSPQGAWGSIFGRSSSTGSGSGQFYVAPCKSCACGCPGEAVSSSSSSSTTSASSASLSSVSPPTSSFSPPSLSSLLLGAPSAGNGTAANSSSYPHLGLRDWPTCAAPDTIFDTIGGRGDVVPSKKLPSWYGDDRDFISARCRDSCPIHLHWHVVAVYEDGFVAKLSIINRGNSSVSDWVALIALPSIANTSAIYSFGYANVSATSRVLYGFTGSNSWLEGTPSPFKGKTFGNVQSVFKTTSLYFFPLFASHALPNPPPFSWQFGLNLTAADGRKYSFPHSSPSTVTHDHFSPLPHSWLNLTAADGKNLFPTLLSFYGSSCSMPDHFPLLPPPQPPATAIPTRYIAVIVAVLLAAVLMFGVRF